MNEPSGGTHESGGAGAIAVVGGGMLGLTLALRFARAGRRVTVFESADRVGGLASSWTLGDITWDRHYHVTLLSDSHLRGLLADIGLAEECEWVETKTGCYARGRLHSISNSVEFLLFPELSLIGKFRLATTILRASRIRDHRPLEDITVEDWLVKMSGRSVFERFWLPLLRSKLGENYKRTSAAFIWATIQRLYAARRSGLKKEMFGYVRGGYDRVLSALASAITRAGGTIRTATVVARVTRCPEGIEVQTAQGERQSFECAVVTAPASIAARMCPELTTDETQRLNGVSYQGIVCASALVRNRLSPFYVTNLLDDDLPFTGVIEMTTLVDPATFGGRHLLYLPRYTHSDDPLFERSDAEIEESYVSALERMFPQFRRSHDLLAFRVSRVRHVHALSTLHYSKLLPSVTTSIRGLFLANSAHIVNGTLNVNETVKLADSVAASVLAGGPA